MDIEMPDCDGLTATRLIRAEMPQIKIVMLTVSASDENLFEAVKSGASGYYKSQSADRFLELVAQVEGGAPSCRPSWLPGCWMSSPASHSTSRDHAGRRYAVGIDPRQVEILTLVAQGATYQQIGETLHLSEADRPLSYGGVLERLHLKNRSQVIAFAARHGLSASLAITEYT